MELCRGNSGYEEVGRGGVGVQGAGAGIAEFLVSLKCHLPAMGKDGCKEWWAECWRAGRAQGPRGQDGAGRG